MMIAGHQDVSPSSLNPASPQLISTSSHLPSCRFQIRSQPLLNHSLSFVVTTPSFYREEDTRRPTEATLCPGCRFQHSRLPLHSQQLEILSGGENPRRGKLVSAHIRFHLLVWSQPPSSYRLLSRRNRLRKKGPCSLPCVPKDPPLCTVSPVPREGLSLWVCQSPRCQVCPTTFQSSIHPLCSHAPQSPTLLRSSMSDIVPVFGI